MNKIIKKLFYKPAWAVACRKIEKNQNIFPNMNQTPYDVLLPKYNEWYADSFCFSEDDRVYVFMEVKGRNGVHGTIGVTEYTNGRFTKVKDALIEPFHLSYPNVFKYKSHYYMIPETCEAGEIRLYESDNFPYNWKLKKVLYEDIQVVDSSFMPIDENRYLFFAQDISDDSFKLRMFILDLDDLNMTETKEFANIAGDRPGGNVIEVNKNRYRVLQDCTESYGKELKIYQIDSFDFEKSLIEESYLGNISIDSIPFSKKKPFDRIHTLTRSGEYEAIDTQYSKFFLNKPLQKIMRKMKGRL